jgi:hypothetical protein
MGFEPYSSPLWAREEYLHVVYNPVDGQYKASVKIAWDAQHLGVRAVTVARPGVAVVQNSAQLSGEHEYLTAHRQQDTSPL